MFVHFINTRPVAISENNLFSYSNNKFLQLKKLLENKSMNWENDYKVVGKNSYEFTITQTKLFTSHENFDTKYYDFIQWLAGVENNRDITKNFN